MFHNIELGTPVGSEVVTTSTAHHISEAGVIENGGMTANRGFISVETQPVRITFDGNAASATSGHLVPAGDYVFIEGEDALRKLSICDTAAGAAKVTATTGFLEDAD